MNAAIGSALSCPKGWSSSGYVCATFTAMCIKKDDKISVNEFNASEIIARLPENIPTINLITKRNKLMKIASAVNSSICTNIEVF